MPQVSKYLLEKQVKNRVFEVFWKTIAGLNTTPQVKEFFDELLTPTEKIMLAKRLAISILLYKKYSYEDIVDILKVSPSTIGNIARFYVFKIALFSNTTLYETWVWNSR